MEFCDTKHHDTSDTPFRVEYVPSTGYVIVDQFGHESVLGYPSEAQAKFAAECMTDGFKLAKCDYYPLCETNKRLMADVIGMRDKLVNAECKLSIIAGHVKEWASTHGKPIDSIPSSVVLRSIESTLRSGQ